MSEQRAINPFVPGRGALPPYLAGREAEQREMWKLCHYVEARRGAPRDIVLSGPRGNGKTVLMRWFQREIEALDGKIDVLWRTPSDFPDIDSLATTLVPPGRFKSLLPDTLSLSIGIGRLGWDLGGNPGTLAELLALRCNHRPLVLLVDEAHTLDRDVGRALLNASQSVAAMAPFLLALAGTPGLEPHLHSMSATFWDRARQLGIGRLDETAAAAALTYPLARQEPAVVFTDSALQQVIDESQGYPYFLQVWGAALWEAASETSETVIDASVAARARPAFELERAMYYQHRLNELERRELLPVAARVADAFAGQANLLQGALNAAIAGAPGVDSASTVTRCRDHLAAVGYVWNPPGAGDSWQAGIPSLMSHVRAAFDLASRGGVIRGSTGSS